MSVNKGEKRRREKKRQRRIEHENEKE